MDLFVLENTLDNAAFAILFVTMLLYWSSIAFPRVTVFWTLGSGGMAIASLCTTALLIARWVEAGYFPISNLYESLFFLTWGITTVHLIAESMSRNRLVGAFTAPVAMGITAFATLSLPDSMQASEPLVPALKSNWLMMHVSVMMLSYATLLVGSLLAIAFLVVTRGQNIELRGSSVGTGAFRSKGLTETPAPTPGTTAPTTAGQPTSVASPTVTPSPEPVLVGSVAATATATTATVTLTRTIASTAPSPSTTTATLSPQRLTLADTLDNISYRIIGLGFPLLTIGIIAGAVWANEAWGTYWSWDPKETWALITWLVFAAYLHARITKGWQGRRPAILAATGFAVVWVCYLGVNILGKGLHSYGWFF
ncbi:MAG: c-type cytochrome biogenesis protein CcsB [Prochlorothrix sp.]|nr:c-type cytochrome biogenesis protein CcsB [Prochlorothrix sp.]